ncbi:hypothetical protein XENOCAPTIV_006473 [Xenoophorus captivus]|uniref:Uncharacterized protein n=1 Tax=Xenoophorus captivus TaxID=1517983 RepID=A0ABV0QQA2_9TELE
MRCNPSTYGWNLHCSIKNLHSSSYFICGTEQSLQSSCRTDSCCLVAARAFIHFYKGWEIMTLFKSLHRLPVMQRKGLRIHCLVGGALKGLGLKCICDLHYKVVSSHLAHRNGRFNLNIRHILFWLFFNLLILYCFEDI